MWWRRRWAMGGSISAADAPDSRAWTRSRATAVMPIPAWKSVLTHRLSITRYSTVTTCICLFITYRGGFCSQALSRQRSSSCCLPAAAPAETAQFHVPQILFRVAPLVVPVPLLLVRSGSTAVVERDAGQLLLALAVQAIPRWRHRLARRASAERVGAVVGGKS